VAEWIHLAEAMHVGPERFKALVAAFGSPGAVFEDLPRAASVANNAQAAKGLTARRGLEDEARAAAERALEAATRTGGAVLLSDDPRYPARLLRSRATPPLLYVRGRVERVHSEKPWLAIVGSREATPAALRVAREVARALAAEGWVIVSGMADGIDQAAHEAALNARGLTVAVLPSGPDVATPATARPLYERIVETGLVVSEYAFGVHARSDAFKKRNQVTVGLSDAVLVVQSAVDGGTMIAAKAATDDGRLLLTLEPLDAHAFGGNQKLLDEKLALGVPAASAVDSVKQAVRARSS
jgi:DNA processing protein